MGIFGKLTQAALSASVLPFTAVKDIVTCGGALDDEDEPYTVQRLKKIKRKLDSAYKDLGK